MFCATWAGKSEDRAQKACNYDAVIVNIGNITIKACKSVKQLFDPVICHGDALETQLKLLIENLDQMRSPGKYGQDARGLVFCSRVETVPGVVRGLQAKGVSCAEFTTKNLSASERDETYHTDEMEIRGSGYWYVLGRGFDFHNRRCVINFDMPRNIVDSVHRIGRTGRAGLEGTDSSNRFILDATANFVSVCWIQTSASVCWIQTSVFRSG